MNLTLADMLRVVNGLPKVKKRCKTYRVRQGNHFHGRHQVR